MEYSQQFYHLKYSTHSNFTNYPDEVTIAISSLDERFNLGSCISFTCQVSSLLQSGTVLLLLF